MEVDVEKIEEFLFDLSLYGSITFSELLDMPMKKIKNYQARVLEKSLHDTGKKGTKYL